MIDAIYEGAAELERAWREGLLPDPLLTVSEWSDRHRMLSSKASAEPGRWRTSRTPYLKAIMDCLSPTSAVERVVFMKAAQLGATEMGSNWIGYRAAKATVIDSIGQTSDSIDIVVYDRQYSPLVFEQAGFLYVAAEAVYAVFEVKQSLNAEHVAYAADKAASVRRLTRTSAPVVDIRGQTPKKEPIQILAGLLTTDIQWAEDNVEAQLRKHLEPLDASHKLDLLCAAESFAFDMRQNPDGFHLAASRRDAGLVFFLFGVLERLQMMGTVAPIDFSAYRGAI